LDSERRGRAAAAEPLLEVRGIRAGYGHVTALSGLDLEVLPGELVAIVGGNGAGKTTLLRVVSGQIRPAAGSVLLDGRDVTGKRPDELVRLGLAHVPEGRQVLSRLTVEENLRLGAYRRRDRGRVRADLDQVYGRFPQLADRRGRPAGTLSGGEQQMLAFGRALMGRPRLLLLDEPSLGLAPLVVEQVFALVKRLQGEGLTILLVEQNARQALRIADRAYVQETGRAVLSGPGPDLMDDPRVQEAYLGGRRGRRGAGDAPARARARAADGEVGTDPSG
jgi:branched-chain amino acid transport system ATP-binding protein